MSEYGDMCRELRQRRARIRATWIECPTCAVRYGTGTKVPPGGTCRNCGWHAATKKDDTKASEAKP